MRTDVLSALEFLNGALLLAPETITKLVEHRVPCPEKLADNAPLMVKEDPGTGELTVSVFGLINSLFGFDEDGRGFMCRIYDDETGEILGFARTPGKRMEGDTK